MIMLPPNEIFERSAQSVEKTLAGDVNNHFKEVTKDSEGRILSVYDNWILPRKGMTYPSAVKNNNVMKSVTVMLLAIAKFRPTKKWLNEVAAQIIRVSKFTYISDVPDGKNQCDKCLRSDRLMRTDFLKYQHYTACGQELWHLLYMFLRKLGLNVENSFGLGKIAATELEYEEPYRLRVEDIFTEMNKEALLENPSKELTRVMEIFIKREKHYVGDNNDYSVGSKFKRVIKLLRIALKIPYIKNAFLFAIKNSDFKKLRLDSIDLHTCFFRGDYDFLGATVEQRQEMAKQLYASKGYELIFN